MYPSEPPLHQIELRCPGGRGCVSAVSGLPLGDEARHVAVRRPDEDACEQQGDGGDEPHRSIRHVGAEDGQELIDAVEAHSPDLAIVDIRMPVVSGIEAIRRLMLKGCTTIPIVLTVYTEPELVEESLKAGARGFVLKSRLSQDLRPAILEAETGRQFVSPL